MSKTEKTNTIQINSWKDIPGFLGRYIFTFEGKVYFHSRSEKGNYPLGITIQWKKVSEEPELYDCWIVEKK